MANLKTKMIEMSVSIDDEFYTKMEFPFMLNTGEVPNIILENDKLSEIIKQKCKKNFISFNNMDTRNSNEVEMNYRRITGGNQLHFKILISTVNKTINILTKNRQMKEYQPKK